MTILGYNEWFQEFVEFYRKLEFFTDGEFCGLSNLECQKKLEGPLPERCQEVYEEQVRTCSQVGKQFRFSYEDEFLTYDNNRAIYIDAEGVWRGENYYQNLVYMMGKISRNIFHPTNVLEEWNGDYFDDDSTIKISFESHSDQIIFETEQRGDYVSYNFIILINELISQTGQQFRSHSGSGDLFLICQSDLEVNLISERGFSMRDLMFNTQRNRDLRHLHRHKYRDYVWLFINRGIIKYRSGNQSEAWEDWNYAAEIGDSTEVYTKVSEIIEAKELKNYF